MKSAGLPDIKDLSPEEKREAGERLAEYLRVYSALKNKSGEELVDLALAGLCEAEVSQTFELVVEELCSRVDPKWAERETVEATDMKDAGLPK